MKTVKFTQVLKFSENLVKVDKPEEERYVTVLLYGRGVIEREIKEGKVPVAFTGYKAHAGQLIISTINARNGAAGIIPAELEGAVVSKDFPLFDIDHECVDEQYLLYYLWSDSFIHKAEQNSFGATMPRLHVKPFLNMQMRLPALSEQKRRAHTLCHVESLLNTQRHLLTKLDELVKSRFVEMFGDPMTNPKGYPCYTVGDIIEFQGGSQPDKKYFEYVPSKDNIRLIQIRDYKSDKYITYIPRAMAKRFCTADDIMIGRYGPPIFQILKGIEGSFNVALMKATPKQGNREFIREFLKQDCLLEYLEGLSQRTAGQDGIQMDKLKAYPFPYPPIALQDRFAAFVAEVDKSKLAVKQSLEKLETLKKSLMQEYFG